MTDECSTAHPHEPEIPPTLDEEGRCLVCQLTVKRERAEALAAGVRSFLESLPFQPPEGIGLHARVKLREPLEYYDEVAP